MKATRGPRSKRSTAAIAAVFVVVASLGFLASQPRAASTNDPAKEWFPNWIGLPWSGDSLSRMQVTDHSEVDFVFTATETSSLVSISPWLVANKFDPTDTARQ